MPQLTIPRNATPEELRKRLLVAIKEAENRGLPVETLLRDNLVKKQTVWHMDSRGYFPRRDGKLFDPY